MRRPVPPAAPVLAPVLMRALLLCLLVAWPCGARAAGTDAVFAVQPQDATPGEVFAAALEFMAPRILDPVPVPQLTLWGLQGLRAIDPALSPELTAREIRLSLDGRVLLARPVPAADDPNGWGLMAGEAVRAAAEASAPVREAGRTGVVAAFFDGLFGHLDPYSRYVPPDDAEGDRARRSGTAGIGVTLADRRGRVVVRAVLADGPGAEAGLRPGDQVLAVNGARVQGRAAETATMLAGPDGSTVTLLVRGRDRMLDEVEATRATLPPETVFAERQGDLLLLRLTSFSRDTDDRMASELSRNLGAAGGARIRGVVIDLRGNRGGLLRQAAEAVSKVLERGLIATTAGRDRQADHQFHSVGADMTGGRPLVVLVDGRSASAAEIMAAALADNARAVVVGTATLGKGLVQTIAPLPDGGELFVTWSRVLAPLGWPLQGLGVLPQVCTSLGREALDRQLGDLARGIDPLRPALSRIRAARPPVSPAEVAALRAPCPPGIGGDADMAAARALIANPDAYAAALLPARPRLP